MNLGCKKSDCTVVETGVCLLNNNPETCPERSVGASVSESIDTSKPPLSAPERNPRFASSLTLTPDSIRDVCAGRVYRLIGVLGAPDAGKTATLVSLYLLLSRDKLERLQFADSMSLLAFDEISRGARQWNDGQPPEQMTNHTEIPDDRTAGFLHLRLRERTSDIRHDVLLSDLPGEWSTSLIDSNRVDRLEFLKAADVVWVMIDGRQLIDSQTRQQALHRTELLMGRLSKFLGAGVPPVFIVISHRDIGVPSEASLGRLEAEGTKLGLSVTIVQVASFSDNDKVAPGTGIEDLIEISLKSRSSASPSALWPTPPPSKLDRRFLNFRAGELAR